MLDKGLKGLSRSVVLGGLRRRLIDLRGPRCDIMLVESMCPAELARCSGGVNGEELAWPEEFWSSSMLPCTERGIAKEVLGLDKVFLCRRACTEGLVEELVV